MDQADQDDRRGTGAGHRDAVGRLGPLRGRDQRPLCDAAGLVDLPLRHPRRPGGGARRRRTHPPLPGCWDGEHRPNPRYTEPTAFLTERARREIDPLERSRPDLALTDPAPADGRRAAAALAATTTLDRETIDGLMVGVSEALANAIRHGRPPVELRAWAAPDRVLVVVRDRGSGPSDPYAGYLPRRGEQVDSGLGLWITRQVCSRVTLTQTPEGFAVRLVAGTPYPVSSRGATGKCPGVATA